MLSIQKTVGRISFGITLFVCLLLILMANHSGKAIAQAGPTATLQSAVYFLYPLPQPTWGSYSNNRYGVQNQYLSGSSCFVNIQGTRLPRNQLYHAGSDWFHKPDANAGIGKDLSAIGTGEVIYKRESFYPGDVIIAIAIRTTALATRGMMTRPGVIQIIGATRIPKRLSRRVCPGSFCRW